MGNRMCCFSSKTTEPDAQPTDSDADSPWLIPNPHSIRKTKSDKLNVKSAVQSRLWSPAFPVDLKLQCLQFVFRIDVGPLHGSNTASLKSPSLALLQRREG